MALFKRKKADVQEKTGTPISVATVVPQTGSGTDLSHVLRNPRITEKATMHQEKNMYTFDIAERATKSDVKNAVRALYGVLPRKVRVVTVLAKQRRNARTGTRGVTRGGKKAYVYLKKGETITIS